MEISIFSVLMTILWSSMLIALFYFLRTKAGLLHICSISTMILLYVFCAVRITLPIELPWTYVLSGGDVYRGIYSILFFHEVGAVRILELVLLIWIIGIVYNLLKYLIKYYNAMRYIRNISRVECEEGRKLLEELDKGKRIELIKASSVESPCCIGVFRKRILLPNKEYTKDELRYILLHEYAHLSNNDILLSELIMVLCWIYWWNPIVYLMEKELNQSLEIRCDLSVTKHLDEKERADYLKVMLDAYVESRAVNEYVGAVGFVGDHSEGLVERFRIVADMRIVQEKHASVFVGFLMLLVLIVSYSFIFQSEFETPISEIETDENAYYMTPENAYIIKRGDTYVLHFRDEESIISEKMVEMMLNEGFVVKGGE